MKKDIHCGSMKLESLIHGGLRYAIGACDEMPRKAKDGGDGFDFSSRKFSLNGRTLHAHRLVSKERALGHCVEWALEPGVSECFHVYKGLAVAFPLAKEKEEFLSLYDKKPDPKDVRIRESFASGVDHTFHDIKGYGNVVAFRNPNGTVVAFYHLGMTRRTRLDVLNNGGKRFSLRLRTEAPLPETEVYEILNYETSEDKFWWQPALEYADAIGMSQNLFRITMDKLVDRNDPELIILGRNGEKVDIAFRRRIRLNEDWQTLKSGMPVKGDVFRVPLVLQDSTSAVYEIKVTSGNAVRNTLFIKKPESGSRADILYVFETNAWRSYAMNGHYHGPIDHCFPWSYSYSATIMEGVSDIFDDVPSSCRYPLQPTYYNNMPPYARLCSGFIDSLASFCHERGLSWHACGEEDIADGSVDLRNYRLAILGNHAEYSTLAEMAAFKSHLDKGGSLIVLGGDAFGRRVDYIKDSKGNIRYQKLFKNTVLGLNVKADSQGHYKWKTYPQSAQYSNAQRLARFGLCYCASPAMTDKPLLTVEDNGHPITKGYKLHEVISESRWEGDCVNPDWRVLVSICNRNTSEGSAPLKKIAALAVHPKWNLCCLGPMGLNETLAGYYGDKSRVSSLFSRVMEHFLSQRPVDEAHAKD